MIEPNSPLIENLSVEEYKKLFVETLCRAPKYLEVETGPKIKVKFEIKKFEHAFFDSVHAKDDTFSPARASRMVLIESLLEDPFSERYFGYLSDLGKTAFNRCALIHNRFDFVVIIEFRRTKNGDVQAHFVTCFVANKPATIGKIQGNGSWNYEQMLEQIGA